MVYFTSKRDLWLGIVVWLPLVITFGLVGWQLWLQKQIDFIFVATFVLLFAFIGWLWWGTGYLVTERDLKIKSGPFRQAIPLVEIKAITPSKSILSAPALSLDRLEISYGRSKSVLISPLKKEEFLALMKEKCPLGAIKSAF